MLQFMRSDLFTYAYVATALMIFIAVYVLRKSARTPAGAWTRASADSPAATDRVELVNEIAPLRFSTDPQGTASSFTASTRRAAVEPAPVAKLQAEQIAHELAGLLR